MQNLIATVKKQAQKNPKRIVFPEIDDERVKRAIEEITKLGIAKPITFDLEQESEQKEKFAKIFYELRKEKGVTLEQARKLMEDRDYFGVMMVYTGEADGMVSGCTSPTASTLRPALQIIRTKKPFHKVSGVFFMVLQNRLLLFADAAVNPEPNSHDLAGIAIDTAETAKRFGIEPKIAMLSFSTHGSARHPLVDKIKEATELVKHQRPDLMVDGELQVDSALVPEVAMRKCPASPLKGEANVLIFPDLQAANISYKLVERLAKAVAIGPILQGLNKPVNDLSRGCSWEDIMNVTAFTVCEAQGENFMH